MLGCDLPRSEKLAKNVAQIFSAVFFIILSIIYRRFVLRLQSFHHSGKYIELTQEDSCDFSRVSSERAAARPLLFHPQLGKHFAFAEYAFSEMTFGQFFFYILGSGALNLSQSSQNSFIQVSQAFSSFAADHLDQLYFHIPRRLH